MTSTDSRNVSSLELKEEDWSEHVEVDIAELVIIKKYVNDRNNVMKRKSNPIGEMDRDLTLTD